MNGPIFLNLEQVLDIHRMQLKEFGGQEGIRDQNLLESAIAQAEAGFAEQYLHDYPYGMAAAYAFHIAENQPFLDGNKRTALNAALTFLDLNGVFIKSLGSELVQAMLDMAAHRLSKEGLADIFKRLTETKA